MPKRFGGFFNRESHGGARVNERDENVVARTRKGECIKSRQMIANNEEQNQHLLTIKTWYIACNDSSGCESFSVCFYALGSWPKRNTASGDARSAIDSTLSAPSQNAPRNCSPDFLGSCSF